jgi:tetratricopeptide (TPR) repeat protein
MEFEEALAELDQFDSSNVVQAHLANYIQFIELFIEEDEEAYEDYNHLKNQRLNYVASKGDRNSPYYLFIQADIRLQWAVLEVKFGDFLAAFRDIKRGYALLEENHKRFPDFSPNEKDRGMLVALVGTLPDKYQWGFEWLSGIPGDIYEGERILEKCLEDTQSVFANETRVMYAMLQLHLLKNERKAWKVLQELTIPAEESGMVTFLLANTALNSKRLDMARTYLKKYKRKPGQFPLPHIEFLRGFVEMYSGKYELAIIHFNRFLQKFEGMHYIKTAWLNMAYCHYILGHRLNYLTCLENCIQEGEDLIDEDKYALSFAKEGKILPKPLLKVRLYFDGGNYEEAWRVLNREQHRYEDRDPFHKIALYYRARILDEQAKYEEALTNYGRVLNMPHPEYEYYATKSALQMGLIYEGRDKCEQAVLYFNRCLDIPAETYQTSLHQKAKAGILRCRK